MTTSIGTSAFGTDDDVNALVQQADGKLVAAGIHRSEYSDFGDFLLVRYNPDGSLDGGFGRGGRVVTALGSGFDSVLALLQQADGKLLAAGVSEGTGSVLVRYQN